MNAIFSKIIYELEKHHDLVLVTIVSKDGSSPRGAGSQMLTGESGRLLGTIGGGAVELRSEEIALELLKNRQSGDHYFCLRQNTGEDIGMVCGGEVSVQFQFIDSSDPKWMELSAKLLSMLSAHQPGWLLLNMDGSFPALLDEEGKRILGTCPEDTALPPKDGCLKTEEYFIMPLPVMDRAVIFGGGHCAQALVPVLSRIGFRITVMDNRPELSAKELFPEAEEVICGDYMRIADYISLGPSDYVVIMTNGHSHDLAVQEQVLRQPLAYVGVIGSRRKIAFVNGKLRESGISEEAIARVHSPIGTAIKAVTPEEIAISIAGEMIYERALLREASGAPSAQGCPMHE